MFSLSAPSTQAYYMDTCLHAGCRFFLRSYVNFCAPSFPIVGLLTYALDSNTVGLDRSPPSPHFPPAATDPGRVCLRPWRLPRTCLSLICTSLKPRCLVFSRHCSHQCMPPSWYFKLLVFSSFSLFHAELPTYPVLLFVILFFSGKITVTSGRTHLPKSPRPPFLAPLAIVSCRSNGCTSLIPGSFRAFSSLPSLHSHRGC